MSGAASKRQRPSSGTRERILAAARAVFAEHGYAGTSVRMIARELGISDPAVHYHFPTKQSLYEALLVHPDYGSLPLDSQPLSRGAVVDQVMHLFGWWVARPEFGQMLLREQLSSETRSLQFMAATDGPWRDAVLVPLAQLVGEDAADVSQMLYELLAGVFWDAILSFGDHFEEVVHQPYFLGRVRAMVELAIPGERATP